VQPTLAVPATPAPNIPPVTARDNTADGLRGLAAVTVFLAHFCLSFFPRGFDRLYPGLQTSPATDATIEKILRLPFLSILWNGNFAVCIFFVLSGYVLSRPYYFGNRLETLRDRYLKRYLRLSAPIAASVFIGYVLLKYGLLWNHAGAAISHSDWLNSYFAFTPSFPGVLRDATYRVILLGEDRYNPPLWTMKVEFIGSLITFAFYTLMPAQGTWRKGIHYAIAVLTIGVLAGKDGVFYYAFLLGGLIWTLPKPRAAYKWLLLGAGWFLASFQYDALFRWMPDPLVWDEKYSYSVAGAFLVLWSLRSGMCDGFLASSPMLRLGRLSFSLYLTHFFVIGTFSCWFLVQMQGRFSRPVWASADLLLSALLLIAAAAVFERLVDRPGTRFANWFIGRAN
jgi:peptidoglycan/LPS O-acetylase OafA/YrhL